MLMLVLTEAALFAVFIASYFFLRWQGGGDWPPGELPDPKLGRPSVMVALVVLSAPTVLAAVRATRAGDRSALLGALVVTLVLGASFVALQVYDYTQRVAEYTPQSHAYGSLVYLLTGAHLVHLAAGVLLLGWVLARAAAGARAARLRVAVDVVALYWLFVVALAVVVYLTVTVSPHL
jgi:heme/copper-type cytochrome/quinol oxidase subunit 3